MLYLYGDICRDFNPYLLKKLELSLESNIFIGNLIQLANKWIKNGAPS
ncbi:MAG: hypothetical protein ACK5WP_00850 [Neisseriaceae bacterium]